jgi:simple sugar transport system ATP-binding protein
VRRRIVEQMFGGSEPVITSESSRGATGEVILSLHDVSTARELGAAAIQNLSLDLRQGEVFGIAGVDGNGQKELGEVIAGQRRVTSGKVTYLGRDFTNRGVAASTRSGIGYVTDDRLHEGSVAASSVAENVALKAIGRKPFSNGLWLNRRAMEERARQLITDFSVKTPGPDTPIGMLSGGNIQKLLLGRELALNPRLLVVNKPTNGLDLRTTAFIWRQLRNQADAGNAVLLISSEIDELLEVCDRIGVMYNGELIAILPRAQATPEALGELMLGHQVQVPA